MNASQVRRAPLDRFQRAMRCGKVSGPQFHRNTKHKPHYTYRLHGLSNVQYALSQMWPYLSDPKREQARKTFLRWITTKDTKFYLSRLDVETEEQAPMGLPAPHPTEE